MIIIIGASKGIGHALAHRLSAVHTEPLILAARHQDKLEQVASEISLPGRAVDAVALDLASPESVDAFVEHVVSRDEPVRAICVTAAGFYKGAFVDQSLDAQEELIRANFAGPVRLVTGIARRAKCSRPMDVILITSIGAATNFDSSRSSAMHITTKAALQVFGNVAGRELVGHGIRVCTIAPGTLARGGRSGIPEKVVIDCIELALSLPLDASIESVVIRPTGLSEKE